MNNARLAFVSVASLGIAVVMLAVLAGFGAVAWEVVWEVVVAVVVLALFGWWQRARANK